jgi:hypothetical protein
MHCIGRITLYVLPSCRVTAGMVKIGCTVTMAWTQAVLSWALINENVSPQICLLQVCTLDRRCCE